MNSTNSTVADALATRTVVFEGNTYTITFEPDEDDPTLLDQRIELPAAHTGYNNWVDKDADAAAWTVGLNVPEDELTTSEAHDVLADIRRAVLLCDHMNSIEQAK